MAIGQCVLLCKFHLSHSYINAISIILYHNYEIKQLVDEAYIFYKLIIASKTVVLICLLEMNVIKMSAALLGKERTIKQFGAIQLQELLRYSMTEILSLLL